MITKRQFDVLTHLEKHGEYVSQRDLAKEIEASLGAVNKDVQELEEIGYLKGGMISRSGLDALEPYRVKRAIFIAAGFGSRLVPITLNTPKPLVRVNGTRMIDTMLDAVITAGIEEIYIIRGYLSEQFDQLLYKYPMIKFIENPMYNEANNISSAMAANYLFQNAYIFEADLYLHNKDLITKYQYSTNYIGVPVERTDDWCFITKNGKISEFKLGGKDCYHMFGISYISERDGKRFSEHIKEVYYAPGGKERFWDQVILDYHLDEYDVSVRSCTFEDLVEIDTFRELIELDSTYDVQ